MKFKYFTAKMFVKDATKSTAQYINATCQASGIQTSFHNAMADEINCPLEKHMVAVTVQFPTRPTHPVVHEAIDVHFLYTNIADQ
jgi:hypothetical protein